MDQHLPTQHEANNAMNKTTSTCGGVSSYSERVVKYKKPSTNIFPYSTEIYKHIFIFLKKTSLTKYYRFVEVGTLTFSHGANGSLSGTCAPSAFRHCGKVLSNTFKFIPTHRKSTLCTPRCGSMHSPCPHKRVSRESAEADSHGSGQTFQAHPRWSVTFCTFNRSDLV